MPSYCGDEVAGVVHNAANAWRQRQSAPSTSSAAAVPANAPVTAALSTAGSAITKATDLASALATVVAQLTVALETAGSTDAVALEIEVATAEAAQKVSAAQSTASHAAAARAEAERLAEEAIAAADEMAEELAVATARADAADDARTDAEAQAGAAAESMLCALAERDALQVQVESLTSALAEGLAQRDTAAGELGERRQETARLTERLAATQRHELALEADLERTRSDVETARARVDQLTDQLTIASGAAKK